MARPVSRIPCSSSDGGGLNTERYRWYCGEISRQDPRDLQGLHGTPKVGTVSAGEGEGEGGCRGVWVGVGRGTEDGRRRRHSKGMLMARG
jgi:hypothetical protein